MIKKILSLLIISTFFIKWKNNKLIQLISVLWAINFIIGIYLLINKTIYPELRYSNYDKILKLADKDLMAIKKQPDYDSSLNTLQSIFHGSYSKQAILAEKIRLQHEREMTFFETFFVTSIVLLFLVFT